MARTRDRSLISLWRKGLNLQKAATASASGYKIDLASIRRFARS